MDSTTVIRRPVVTEKSTALQERGRYVFEVATRATKLEIKDAVETAFEVKVVGVNTMIVKGKSKRFGPRATLATTWKKAIVKLAPGESITIFEGV
jgi:large subunit ribosomal protein L23